MDRKYIDIQSRGEVVKYLIELFKNSKIMDCIYLNLRKGYLNAYYPRCLKDFASRQAADNVRTDVTAGSAPSSYFWPICPKDCPLYSKDENFLGSLTGEIVYPDNKDISEYYVDHERIEELKSIKNKDFDLTKLIKLCEELNECHEEDLRFSIGLLVRTILDHIPPIFGQNSFAEVANNYGGSTKSFKALMIQLDTTSRKIADSYLHTQIREKEALPTSTQVNFKSNLDVLLQEIVRIMK